MTRFYFAIHFCFKIKHDYWVTRKNVWIIPQTREASSPKLLKPKNANLSTKSLLENAAGDQKNSSSLFSARSIKKKKSLCNGIGED